MDIWIGDGTVHESQHPPGAGQRDRHREERRASLASQPDKGWSTVQPLPVDAGVLGFPSTLAMLVQAAMLGQPPIHTWPQQHLSCFWKAYLFNWDSFHHTAMTPASVFIGALQQKLTEVLGNLMILTEFCKFHTQGQVLYILCSFTVNKFVFPCLPLSYAVRFEAAPLYLVTDRSRLCPPSPGGNSQPDTGNDLLV